MQRKWFHLTRRSISAALIESNKFMTASDHSDRDCCRRPRLPRNRLGSQHVARTDTRALHKWLSYEHSEVRRRSKCCQKNRANDFIALNAQQDHRVIRGNEITHLILVSSGAIEQIGLAGPSNPTGVATISAIHKCSDAARIFDSSPHEGKRRRHCSRQLTPNAKLTGDRRRAECPAGGRPR